MDDLIRRLAELNASSVLILAVLDGAITDLECAMPECHAPGGRRAFERRAGYREKWAPSADRWPVPGRAGGEYVVGNVRLAHLNCNQRERGRITDEGRARLAATSGVRLAAWNREHPEQRLAAGRIGTIALARAREDPVVHAALVEQGRRLGLTHRPVPSGPEGRAAQREVGRKLAEWNRAHPGASNAVISPEGREALRAGGRRTAALMKARHEKATG